MRISTTSLFLTCAILFTTAISAFALPTVTFTNIKHACGGNANGAFTINVTGATGAQLKVRVFGPPGFTDIDQTFAPIPAMPFTFPVTNAPGSTDPLGQEYVVVVSDGTGNRTVFVNIFDFTVTLNSVTQNTNPGCTSPNGAIDVTLDGSSPAGAITYTWTGPSGALPSTQDQSNLPGGDYNLSYSDGTTTCTLGPIHIDDPAARDFNIATATPSVCQGNGFSVDVDNSDTGWTYTAFEGATTFASVAGNGGSATINIPALGPGPHTIFVVASNGSCPSKQNTAPNVTVTVNPAPDYDNLPATSVCSGTALGIDLETLKKGTSPISASSYVIADPINADAGLIMVTGSPTNTSVGRNELANDVWRNPTSGPLFVTYTIGTFAGVCPGNVITVKVQIDQEPSYNDFSNLAPAGICSRDNLGVASLDALAKAGSGTADLYTVIDVQSSGLTAFSGVNPGPVPYTVASGDLADDKWENVTSASHIVTYRIVPRIGSCDGAEFKIDVEVNAQPFAPDANKTVCSNINVSYPLQVAVNFGNGIASTFTWDAVDNLNVTGESVGTQTTSTISDVLVNKSSITQPVIYNVTPNAGTCVGAPFKVTIQVLPEPAAPDVSKTICSKDNVNFNLQTGAVDLGNSVASTFTWSAADNASVSGESLAVQAGGTITDALVNTSSIQQPVVYDVIPTSASGCVGQAFKVTVNVDPEPVGAPAPKTICSDDFVNFNLQTDAIDLGNAIASTTFSWTATDNTNVTGEAVGTQTTALINDQLVNLTATDQLVDYTVIPTGPTGCVGIGFTVTITVSPRPSYTDLNSLAGICADPLGIDLDAQKGPTSILATAYDVEVIAHGALVAAGGSPALAKIFDAPTSEIADDVWSNTTTGNIDVKYEITPKAGTCVGAPFYVTVTIKPQPDYLDTPATACSSLGIGFDFDAAKNGTSIDASSLTVTNIQPDPLLINVNVPAAPIPNLTKTGIQGHIWKNTTNGPLIVTYTITPFAGTCAGASFDVSVTINPEPVYAGVNLPDTCSEIILGLDLEDLKALSSASAASFSFTTTMTGGTLTPVGTTVASGSGNNLVIADDSWINVSNAFVVLTYHIVPKSIDNCDGVSFDVVVKILPEPDYNSFAAPSPFCAAPLGIDITTLQKPTSITATSFTVVPNPADPALVQIGGTATPNDISDDVWQNVTALPIPLTYDITPSVNGCDGAVFHVDVIIDPQPDYNSYANDNFPGGICSKDAIAVDLTTLKKPASIVATSFIITTPATVPGLTLVSTDPNTISDDVWTNKTTGFVDIDYLIVPRAGSCDGAPFHVVVRVNPEPFAPTIPKTICTGTNVNLDLQLDAIGVGNNIASSTFSWTVTDNPNVTGEAVGTMTTAAINDLLTNLTAVDQTVTYNVTPTSPDGCVGDPFQVIVTVSTEPVIAAGQDKAICSGTSVNLEILLNPVGMPAGTVFTWPAPPIGGATASPPGGVAAGGPGTIHINDVLTNPTASPIIVTYDITPALGSCVGSPVSISITVNPGFIANAGGDQAICSDNGPYLLAGSSVSGAAVGTSGTWSIIDNAGGLGDGVLTPPTDPLDPSTAAFTATVEGTYILQLKTIDDPAGICAAGTDLVVITVTPKPVIAPTPALVCGNDPVGYEIMLTPPNFPANVVFNWPTPNDPTGAAGAQASPPGGVAAGTPGTKHINDILRNETGSNIDVTYDVTPSVGLCQGALQQIVITVKPSPVLALNQTKTICSGDRVDYEILLNPVNSPVGTKFSWPDPDGLGIAKTNSATSRDNVDGGVAGTIHITDTLYHFDPAGLSKTVTYKVISQGVNGCYGRTRDIDIIVNSGAIAEAGPDQIVCSDGVLPLSSSSVVGAATAMWTIIQQPGTDGAITGNAGTPQNASFQGTTPGVYKLQLTSSAPTAGSCPAVSDVVIITVKPIGDPSCTGTVPTCNITATVTVTDATCNNNDGTIAVTNLTGGTGPYTFTLNGTIVNLPANNTFAGLTSNNYTLDITDATNCVKTYTTLISFPGYVNHTAVVTTEPDCSGGGTDGKFEFTITDPGSFEFAVTNDLVVQPTAYNALGGNLVSANNLAVGDYAVWLRPVGAGLQCATKVPVTISGIHAVSYTATASNVTCFAQPTSIVVNDIKGAPGLPFSYTLTNTGDNSVSTGTISASQALSAFSINGVNKGNYSLQILQDQSSLAATCTTPISGTATSFVITGPNSALDTLYVKKAVSVPDLPSGSALVGVAPSGLEPYEVTLELTQPVFASQQFAMDWTEVPLNPQNLKFEYSFTNLYAGVYTLGLRDAGGCEKSYVFTLDVDTQLFIPNIFTPNEDGHNDVFYIRNLPADSKLLITNRWGKEVFKSSSYQNDWDGGDTVDGMYYYTLSLGSQSFTGWVEILRAQ